MKQGKHSNELFLPCLAALLVCDAQTVSVEIFPHPALERHFIRKVFHQIKHEWKSGFLKR
jgi:hypothetical protein